MTNGNQLRPPSFRVLFCIFVAVATSKGSEVQQADYGVDVTFPIHRNIQDKNSIFYKRYQSTMEGCYKAYSKASCDTTEHARIEMNLRQPKSQHNYTEMGFKKTRVPDALFKEITQFYEENKEKEHLEAWPPGNTYVNNWISPTYMISFEDRVSFMSWQQYWCVFHDSRHQEDYNT